MSAAAPTRRISVRRPISWLILGWRDFIRLPVSALHGVAIMGVGQFIIALLASYPLLAPGAFSGFVVVGPILATGLYELSRRIALGQHPGMVDALHAWKRGARPLLALGALLLVLGSLWVGFSAVLVGTFAQAPITDLQGVLRAAIGSGTQTLFLVWVVLGGSGAALVFAMSAVSPAMLLDRKVGLRGALLTSIKAVGDNPVPMAFWATIIMVGTVFGMATLMVGFVVVFPVLGHASWHAYRDLVDASALPPRE